METSFQLRHCVSLCTYVISFGKVERVKVVVVKLLFCWKSFLYYYTSILPAVELKMCCTCMEMEFAGHMVDAAEACLTVRVLLPSTRLGIGITYLVVVV